MTKLDHVRQAILERAEQLDMPLSMMSKSVGKNHAYLQQFIHRGVPAELPEDVRGKLSRILKIPEHKLRHPAPEIPELEEEPRRDWSAKPANWDDDRLYNHANTPDDVPLAGIREVDIRAGLGGGGSLENRQVIRNGEFQDPVKDEAWHFPSRFIREELRATESRVIILETQGDSMFPTISSGDRVIVDTGHRVPSPDGIYAIRDRYDGIQVKRLQVLRRGDPPRILIISDNNSHQDEEVGADEIAIVGRVLWGLKRL